MVRRLGPGVFGEAPSGAPAESAEATEATDTSDWWVTMAGHAGGWDDEAGLNDGGLEVGLEAGLEGGLEEGSGSASRAASASSDGRDRGSLRPLARRRSEPTKSSFESRDKPTGDATIGDAARTDAAGGDAPDGGASGASAAASLPSLASLFAAPPWGTGDNGLTAVMVAASKSGDALGGRKGVCVFVCVCVGG